MLLVHIDALSAKYGERFGVQLVLQSYFSLSGFLDTTKMFQQTGCSSQCGQMEC